ncbi:hypothetical protein [Leptolyngbya sp. FACHB-17]|uniref:hypothetical protein n=1 Tax=unclassified Leptolyngbya TaxID=2650499 RepID=UPI00168064F5|nr:hypothetical protein [Leptolyngbya sp. FACHB-17]MBD2082605.1 hypothetical protein [Leptolyngbya sp. FACHB-17]
MVQLRQRFLQPSWLLLITYVILLHLAWIMTWLLFIGLKTTVFPQLNQEPVAAVWRFMAYFVVWLPPVFAYIYWIERKNPLVYLLPAFNTRHWGIAGTWE